MRKPKNMSPEQELAFKEKKRKERKRWKATHPEKKREENKRRYAAHPEKKREQIKRWKAAHPEWREIQKMSDAYISRLIGLPVSKCPPSLLEAKREQLQITRLNRQLKQLLQEQDHDK